MDLTNHQAQINNVSNSGLLALVLSKTQRYYVLWFRPEVVQMVQWGGDPNKAVAVVPPAVRLSPCRSFAVWKQQVLIKLTALLLTYGMCGVLKPVYLERFTQTIQWLVGWVLV